MIFDQPAYFALLALTILLLRVVPAAYRAHLLWVSGMLFYWSLAPGYFWLVLGLTILLFWHGLWLLWLLLPVAIALALKLGLLPSLIGAGRSVGAIVVPLGLSFLLLEVIGFQLDRAKGDLRKPGFVDYMAFVWFFPCRVAGPIRRFGEFTNSVAVLAPSWENLYRGGVRILIGFAKKNILAEQLDLTVTQLSTYNTYGWAPIVGYALQIYIDLSAYSDIAIGSARTMGIVVPENFDYPYLKSNIRDFWASWHMSLTSWFRDYVFMNVDKSLFKTKLKHVPIAVAFVAYLVTFAVYGLWHGIALNFLVLGLYHGTLLALYQAYTTFLPRQISQSWVYRTPLMGALSTAITFMFVTVGWVLFKYDLAKSVTIFKFMVGG